MRMYTSAVIKAG